MIGCGVVLASVALKISVAVIAADAPDTDPVPEDGYAEWLRARLEKTIQALDSGEMKIAFSLYPVTIQQLFNIADSGNVMPPKSTWFEPKLRDGLLTHALNP